VSWALSLCFTLAVIITVTRASLFLSNFLDDGCLGKKFQILFAAVGLVIFSEAFVGILYARFSKLVMG
jgi:hypothetical protein